MVTDPVDGSSYLCFVPRTDMLADVDILLIGMITCDFAGWCRHPFDEHDHL